MPVCGHVFDVHCIDRAWSFVCSNLPKCCAVCRRVIHPPPPQPATPRPPGVTVIDVDPSSLSLNGTNNVVPAIAHL
jgi:hypothetical protein